jgi:phosphatidylserine/phosphatidylglycerophosphate/cardiolipin synthase-like enzyme
MPTELILNGEHYSKVVTVAISGARRLLWIATSDLKDLHVGDGTRAGVFRPFLGLLAELIGAGVAVRLIHAKEPGPRFRRDFDRYPELVSSDLFERALCPRMHMKVVVVDERIAYVGSANLTGAGLGARGPNRRNFEAGVLTDDPAIIRRLMDQIDSLWLGRHCTACQCRDVCPEPLDGL